MNELDLVVGADPRWVPLELGPDVDAASAVTAQQVLALRGEPSPTADRLDATTAVLAGIARRCAAQAAAMAQAEPPVLTAGAWALCPELDVAPLTVAALRVLELPVAATADDAVAVLVRPEDERHGDVEVDPLATPSGPALHLRWRPVDRSVVGPAQVSEQQAVLWPWPESGLLLVLSAYYLDLVDAGRHATALTDLAGLVEARVAG